MTKFLTTSDSATFCTRSVETTNQRLAKRHLTTTKRPLTTSTTRTTSKRLLLRGAKLLFQYVIIIILIHHLPFSLNRNEHNEHNRNHNRNQLSSSPTVSNGDHKHHLSFRFFAQALQHTNLSPNVLPAPSFIKSMDSLNVRENTPVNEVIYTLEATIESDFAADVRILYDIEETQLFALEDRRSGRVRVAKQIDREQTGDSVSFLVIATPYLGSRPGAQTRLSITVYILDENDNAPKFERVVVGRQEYDQQALAHRIRLNVSEDTPANSTVVDLIEAVDPDTVSSNPLGALCLDCEPEFRLSPKTANSLNE
uniref:Protocadherin-like wing polarity protein stan n=1 Tax=Aceria tosichella TaxID=561515 RepID=A0A6G1SMN1_9ACAR